MDLDRLTNQMAQQAAAIRALVQDVPDEQARWKPSPNDWSILEAVSYTHLDVYKRQEKHSTVNNRNSML